MIPFWISIAVLSLAQGAIVALPRTLGGDVLARLRGRRWALIPPLSVIAFVFIARGAERASAQGLTYLALIAVPPLAALALGWLVWDVRSQRPLAALLVLPLFALAWVDRSGLAGESAALALSALSCVALGVLLAALTRRDGSRRGSWRWRSRTPRWSSPICCSARTTRSTPRTPLPGCRSCSAWCSARR